MNTRKWAKAFIKEHNIPVGIDSKAEEYIKMSEGKIKKNKKYWKDQAKAWQEIAEMETDSANHWAGEYYLLHDEFEELELKFDILKRELNTLRQYNIGKKPNTTGSGINVDWKIYYKDQKSKQAKEDLTNWSNYKEKDPDWSNNPDETPIESKVISLWSKNIPKNPSKKKCNCKNCNCDK